jgi:protein-disulfide isomerase
MTRYPARVLIFLALLSLTASVLAWKWQTVTDYIRYTDFSTPFTKSVTVKDTDRSRGNTDARFVVLEYGDLDCPFCRQFQPVMQKVVGACSDVKWVFRHFPLKSHPYSYQKALLTECAVKVSGSDTAFWPIVDRWYTYEGVPSFTDPELYKKMLAGTTADPAKVMTCVNEGSASARIDAERDEGKALGFSRTPTVVLVDTKTKAMRLIVGAVSEGELRRALHDFGR